MGISEGEGGARKWGVGGVGPGKTWSPTLAWVKSPIITGASCPHHAPVMSTICRMCISRRVRGGDCTRVAGAKRTSEGTVYGGGRNAPEPVYVLLHTTVLTDSCASMCPAYLVCPTRLSAVTVGGPGFCGAVTVVIAASRGIRLTAVNS